MSKQAMTDSHQGQLQSSRFPRYRQELTVISHAGKTLIDGERSFRSFASDWDDDVLARVLPLLDGTWTEVELASQCPDLTPDQLRQVLTSLDAHNLLQNGAGTESKGAFIPDALAFFRRMERKGHDPTADDAYRRLASVQLILLSLSGSADAQAKELKEVLEKNGFQKVILVSQKELTTFLSTLDRSTDQPLLISLSVGSENCDWHAELDRHCATHGLSWLWTILDIERGYADIGPVFGDNSTCCFECFSSLHPPPTEKYQDELDGSGRVTLSAWLSLVAIRVSYRISALVTMEVDQGFMRYQLPDWERKQLFCASIPGCVRCGPAERLDDETTSQSSRGTLHTAVLFEQYLACRRPAFIEGKIQEDFEALCVALSRQNKSLPNSQEWALNRGAVSLAGSTTELLRQSPQKDNPPLSIDQLGAILMVTAGVRQAAVGKIQTRRWVATAGNLGSVELFLLVRGMDGLPPGLYFYQPRGHSLAQFERRSGPVNVDKLISLLVPSSPHTEVVILFTSAFTRLQRKYGAFGYKLSNLDAGVALSQLQLCARNFGIWSSMQMTWPDDMIANLCNLSEGREHVTAVAALSRQNAMRQSVPHAFEFGDDALDQKTAHPPSTFSGLSVDEVFHQLYKESRTSQARLVLKKSSAVALDLNGPLPQEQTFVPPSRTKNGSLGAVLSRRRSVRRYSSDSIDLEQLSNILYDAAAADAHEWPDKQNDTQMLQFLISANRVESLSPAVYRFDLTQHSLNFFGSLPSATEELQIFGGRDFTASAVFIWIGGNLQAACDQEGAFGHRKLLLRAGAAANRLWLSAIALGLEGGIVAGVSPGTHSKQFCFNGATQASLVGFVAGTGLRLRENKTE